jgi:hypothetical protein
VSGDDPKILRAVFIGSPMYALLYGELARFEAKTGLKIEITGRFVI